jgi:class 3 adenylate cyclase
MSSVSESDQERVAAELAQLLDLVRNLGATDTEVEQAMSAVGLRGLGPLALDLAMRPSGASTTRDEFLSNLGVDEQLARRLWRACGLPETTDFPFPVTPDLANALRIAVGMAHLMGEDNALGIARVTGASTARIAEAVSDTFRISIEVPQRESGMPYPDIAREYATQARDLLPLAIESMAALFRRHLVLVSYQRWSADKAGATVTLDRTVGFTDLVSSTETLAGLTTGEIAAMIDLFDRHTWDTVTRAGGRIVKLIGDEAMFVHADARAACEIAKELVATSPHPIRIGLASGEVVALHGDYYGPTVNLAARLTGASPSSAVVVSEAVKLANRDLQFEPIDLGPLKGFDQPVTTFRLMVD